MKREQKYPTTKWFNYYNHNPKNRITGDCAFRAVSLATNIPYNDTVMAMAETMCKTGYALNDTKGIEAYLKSIGWVKHPQPKKPNGKKYTGKEFVETFVKESECCIANIGGHHIVAIVDGKVQDIWDSTYKCIGNYWTKG